MNFLDHLSVWLRTSLSKAEPDKIRGYSFNLIENCGEYSVELIGTLIFDETDPDWVCEKVFEGTPRSISIPEPIHEGSRELCLKNMRSYLEAYLSFGDENAGILQQADGIVVGFVDDDQHTIYKAQHQE